MDTRKNKQTDKQTNSSQRVYQWENGELVKISERGSEVMDTVLKRAQSSHQKMDRRPK